MSKVTFLILSLLPLCFSFRIENLNSSLVNISVVDDVPVEYFEKLNFNNEKPEEVYDIHEKVDLELEDSGCQINIRDLHQRGPLLRNPKSGAILLPDKVGSSVISFKKGERFEIDCPGSFIVVDPKLSIPEVTDPVCVSKNDVSIEGEKVNFSSIVCKKRISSTARYTGKDCFDKLGREIEVGFLFSDGHFTRQMTTCFDPVTRNVYYALYNISLHIGDQDTGGTRPGWTEGTAFYKLGVKLDKLYTKEAQRVTINRQLGLSSSSTKYISTGNNYLAKGHLAARSDYIYYAQQEATFFYINSAPQWQTLNGFNWAYLERNVRQYATKSGLDLTVMTGGYGIATLPHESTGNETELYLSVDKNKALPVPKLFWRVVYSPSTQKGIALLGVNNPYLNNINGSIICPDIADKLTWLSFDRTILNRGYIYACTINDLRKVIKQIPNYHVTGILN